MDDRYLFKGGLWLNFLIFQKCYSKYIFSTLFLIFVLFYIYIQNVAKEKNARGH